MEQKILKLSEVKRIHVVGVLRHVNGNKEHAARLLGVTVKTIFNLLHQWDMFEEFKTSWARQGKRDADEQSKAETEERVEDARLVSGAYQEYAQGT